MLGLKLKYVSEIGSWSYAYESQVKIWRKPTGVSIFKWVAMIWLKDMVPV